MSDVLRGEEKENVHAYGLAARDFSGILSPFHFTKRANGDNGITIKINYYGICHTDLYYLKNDFGDTIYPIVLRHEIVGEVIKVGRSVTKFSIGDITGVGAVVGSCSECDEGFEIYCRKVSLTLTNRVAPLLCAGITLYSPMKNFKLDQPGLHLGVVGLGHIVVKFAKAFNIKVTVINTSPNRNKEALEHLGADAFWVSRDPQQLQDVMGTIDDIIDTISAHQCSAAIDLLKTSGKLVLVGAPVLPLEFQALPLILGRKIIVGSAVGGSKKM